MTRPIQHRSGFTLLELLVGAALSAVILAAVLSSFVFLGRNLTRQANYQVLEAKARETLTYLRRDFALAQSVKTGTTPTASTVTLVLPAGEVTYTYDSISSSLRRQATFGANADFTLLKNTVCSCTSFTFAYYTMAGGTPASQVTPSLSVPYSIKQIQARFIIQTPGTYSPTTQTTYEVVTSRFLLRNKTSPTGT